EIADGVCDAIGLSETMSTVPEMFWAARRFLETLARDEPLIIVFEDIHWAEQTFLDLIRHLLDATSDAPVVLVCTARRDLVEDHPDWVEDRPGATSLMLHPLSDALGAAVVEHLR